MEEDILGQREEAIGDRYSRCMRCGQVISKTADTLLPVEGGDTVTEQLELCAECQREIESGEAAWAPEAPEDQP